MPTSMTAFANLSKQTNFGNITCEMRSVNSRFLDMNLNLPESLRFLEKDILELVKNSVTRGKFEARIFLHNCPEAENLQLNVNLVENLADLTSRMQEEFKRHHNENIKIDLTRILQYPNILLSPQNVSEEFSQICLTLVKETLAEFISNRKLEGKKLAEFIASKAQAISELVQQIQILSKDATIYLKDKLEAKIDKLNTGLDEAKISQEVAILVQKYDISEELDRITSHIIGVNQALQLKTPSGRKLDFLSQELQRESNTLSAKAYKIEISNLAIEIKVLVEQIREQVQNLE